MKVKLADALLRRKELVDKVEVAREIRKTDLFQVNVRRINVTEDTDECTAKVPKLNLSQVTAEHDFYAKRLRLIDALIQQTNWTAEVDTIAADGVDLFADFPIPEEDRTSDEDTPA